MAMEMQPLESTNLAAAGYDAETKTMKVEFLNGGVYSYAGVPKDVYDGLVAAPSSGQYFARNVKGHYSFVREA